MENIISRKTSRSSKLIVLKVNQIHPDSSILYVMEANDGTIGYSVDAYGAFSNHDDVDYDGFIVKVPVEERGAASVCRIVSNFRDGKNPFDPGHFYASRNFY